MGQGGGVLEFPAGDPIRDYSPDEKRSLTENLVAVAREVHGGHLRARTLTLSFLVEVHKRVFEGVRKFAGVTRGPRSGTAHLVFGPNRSVHRDDVPAQLEAALLKAETSLSSLLANPRDADYERAAIHLAVWLQTEIIRIHPFEDGNGRVSRLLSNHVLVRLGLRPIPLEACRQEYIDLLNAYYGGRTDLAPLVDLHVRIAAGLA